MIEDGMFHFYNSMGQNSTWEDHSFSANYENPRILCNPKVHYPLHNSLLLVFILRETISICTLKSYFLKAHFNIILPSTPRFPKWYLSLTFAQQFPVCICPIFHVCYTSIEKKEVEPGEPGFIS